MLVIKKEAFDLNVHNDISQNKVFKLQDYFSNDN